MRTLLSLMLAASLAAGLMACSDDPVKADPDGNTVKLDKGGPSPDGGAPDQAAPDLASPDMSTTTTTAAQTVINKLTLPKSGTDYAVDLDGNGSKDNQLGNIMGALKLMGGGFDPQKDLDTQVNGGQIILLFDLKAKSLTDDPSMKLKFYLGQDLDNDPLDNFGGKEEFGIDAKSPTNLVLPGKIVSSKLTAGPGSMMVPVPIGTSTTTLSLKKAAVKSTIGTNGMSAGQINGAIPMKDVNDKLLPSLATMLDKTWKSTTDPMIKNLLGGMDTDKDGTIEGSDLTGNLLIGIFIKADVDTDGDKTMDAMSVGMGFTAVNCKIKGS